MTQPYTDALRRARNHFRPEVASLMHEPTTTAERLADYHATLRDREIVALVLLLHVLLAVLLFVYR